MDWVGRGIKYIESKPHSIYGVLFMVLLVTSIRTIEEWLHHKLKDLNLNFILHSASFYMAMYMVNVTNLSIILKRSWKEFSSIVAVGLVIGILPPILDIFNPNIGKQDYTYLTAFSVFLTSPKEALGETLSAWIWIFGFSFYVGYASKSVKSFIFGLSLVYGTVQCTAWLTSVIIEFVKKQSDINVSHLFSCLWWILIALIFYIIQNKARFNRSIMRFHHAVVWGVLTLVGAKAALGQLNGWSFLYAFIMMINFFFILIENDFYDKAIDRLGHRASSVESDDLIFIYYCHIVWILIAGIIHVLFGLLVFTFFMLSLAYHLPSLYFKKHFFTNSCIEGFACMLCILAGASISTVPNQSIVILMVLGGIGFMMASNFKDYKDFAGDLAAGMNTLYVYFAKKGWGSRKANQCVVCMLFVVLMIPNLWFFYLKISIGLMMWPLIFAFMAAYCLSVYQGKRAVNYTMWSIIFYLGSVVWILPKIE